MSDSVAYWDWDTAMDSIHLSLVETASGYSMHVAVPENFEKQELKVTVRDNVLTVMGVSAKASIEPVVGGFSSFQRSLRIPKDIDREGISAGMKDNNILHIDLPKLKGSTKGIAFEVEVAPAGCEPKKHIKLIKKLSQRRIVPSSDPRVYAAKLKLAEIRRRELVLAQQERLKHDKKHAEAVRARKAALKKEEEEVKA